MINLPPERQKILLTALLSVLVLLIGYRAVTGEKPQTAPLAYPRGSVATSSVRASVQSPAADRDPLQAFIVKREEKYPGMIRDLFRMENPAPPRPVVKTAPTPTVIIPAAPVKTAEEIAAEASRAELSRFRFIGYLTDKDSSLFLARDGELFIVRSGDPVLKTYRVKEAGREYVVLLDTVTRVELRIELSGADSPRAR